MTTSSYVAANDLTKHIDTTSVTADDGTTQYRQVVSIGDPALPDTLASVSGVGLSVDAPSANDLLSQILVELRVLNTQIQATLNGKDDLDQLRNSSF